MKYQLINTIDRISNPDYEPTDRDILRQRRPTTGLIEENITMVEYQDDNIRFKMVDVGGAKNERKKWIHQFENVSAVIFVISLTAFDEPLYEDETQNSLLDAIQLFSDAINGESHWFKRSSLFLIFNKMDLFAEKIIEKSLKECFGDEYDEDAHWNNCDDQEKIDKNVEFIKQKFIEQVNDKTKSVVSFVTCAHEATDIQRVFRDISENIVEVHNNSYSHLTRRLET